MGCFEADEVCAQKTNLSFECDRKNCAILDPISPPTCAQKKSGSTIVNGRCIRSNPFMFVKKFFKNKKLKISYKFQTFLKMFEKNDGKVILMSTNIIMGQLNIKDYEYDNGITIF